MHKEICIKKKCVMIGNSRGFIINKDIFKLKSNKLYGIKIISEESVEEHDKTHKVE
jgi:hypothetical protein